MKPLKTFVGQSFKHFIKVGAFFPSSSFLARRMAKEIKCKVVLELGPGTGIVTKKILKKLPADGKLISIENNVIFANYLKNQIQDTRLFICTGDALQMKKFLKEHGIEKVDCIVSSLPLGNFRKEDKEKMLKEITNSLNDNGEYVQYEYLLAGVRAVKEYFPSISFSYEILNIPPAFVMRCKKFKK